MPGRLRFTFRLKLLAALLLIGAADYLLWWQDVFHPGSALGGLALLWTGCVAATSPALRRGAAGIALLLAGGCAAALVHEPGPLRWTLFWASLASASLLARRGFDDAARHGLRLAAHAVIGVAAPLFDLLRLIRIPRPNLRRSLNGGVAAFAVPVAGTLLFGALFASANPLFEQALGRIEWPRIDEIGIVRILWWLFVLAAVWPTLRPLARFVPTLPASTRTHAPLPGINGGSVTVSLLAFNALFLVQNLSDVAFLWSGASLPPGITMTDYVHRGAYPLIATALIAGFFVLVAAPPGSAVAARPLVRRLVLLWLVQNVVLVASSILRTLDYIETSMLTTWRIAALEWMALVAIGLALIGWRTWAGRSARWLINANALAAAVALAAGATLSFPAIAAWWNVGHAREVTGHGERLDLCYLRRLGDPAVGPLAALEAQTRAPALRERVAFLRGLLQHDLERRQRDWRQWTLAGAWRLADVPNAPPPPRWQPRTCEGAPYPPETSRLTTEVRR